MEKKRVKFDGLQDRKTERLSQEAEIILSLLRKHYEIELSDEPDYIFYNVNGSEYYRYDGVRIFCTIEAICPDFNLCDYGIGFEYLDYGDRYFRFPNYAFYPDITAEMADKHKNIVPELADREFCSFVYSNGAADPMRRQLFEALSEYRQVDSGGCYLNNQKDGKGVADKSAFERKHKFSIACENASHPGYHTEKLTEAFAAGTVPIYWGDPLVTKVFNPKAFINVKDYPTVETLREKIQELDQDKEAYLRMLREPALCSADAETGEQYARKRLEELERYLLHIFEQPMETAYRRNRGFWGMQYLQEKRSKERVIDKYNKLRETPLVRLARAIRYGRKG